MSSGRYDLESRRSKTFGLLSQTKGTFRKLDDQPISDLHLHRSLDEGMLDREFLHGRIATETQTYNECAVDVEFSAKTKDSVDAKKLTQPEVTSKENSILNPPPHPQEESRDTKQQSPGKTFHKKSKSLDEKAKAEDKDKKHGGFLERLTKGWRKRDGDESQSPEGRKKKRGKNGHRSGSSSSSDSDRIGGNEKHVGQNGKEMYEIKLANSESQASLDTKLQYDHEEVTVIPISEFKVNDEISQSKVVFSTPETAQQVKYQDINGGLHAVVTSSPKYMTFAPDSVSDEESPGRDVDGHEICGSTSENSDVIVDITPSPCFYDSLAHEKPVEQIYDRLEFNTPEVSPYEEILFGNDAVTLNNPVISSNPDKVSAPFTISDNGIDLCLQSIAYEDFSKDTSRNSDEHINTDSCSLVEDKKQQPSTDVAQHFLNIDDTYQSINKRQKSSSNSSTSSSTKLPPDTESSSPLNTESSLPSHEPKTNQFKTFKLEATVVISPDDDLSENTMTYFGPVFLKPQKEKGEEFFKVVVAPILDQPPQMAVRNEDSRIAGLSGQASHGVAKLSPEKCWPETRRSEVTTPTDPTPPTNTCLVRDVQIEQLVVNSPSHGGGDGKGEEEDQADASRKPEDLSPEIKFQINESPTNLRPDHGTKGVTAGGTLEDVHGKRRPCVSDTKLQTDENGLDSFGRVRTKETIVPPLNYPANPKSCLDSSSSNNSETDSDSDSKKSQHHLECEPNVHIRQDGKRVEFLNPRTFLNRIKGSSKQVFGLSKAVKIPVSFVGHLYPETKTYKILEETITIEHVREPEPEQKTIEFFTVPKQSDVEQNTALGSHNSLVIEKIGILETEIELLNNNQLPGTNCAGQSPETKLLHENMEKISLDQQNTVVVSDVDRSCNSVDVVGYSSPVSSPKLLFKQMQNLNLTETSVDGKIPKVIVENSGSSSSSSSDSDSSEKSKGKVIKISTADETKTRGASKDKIEKSLKKTHQNEKLEANKDIVKKKVLSLNDNDATVKTDSLSVLQVKQESSGETSEDEEVDGSNIRVEGKVASTVLLDGECQQQSREEEHVDPLGKESMSVADSHVGEPRDNHHDDDFTHGYHQDDVQDFVEPCRFTHETVTPSSSSFSSSSGHSDEESDDSSEQYSYDVTVTESPTEAQISKTDVTQQENFTEQKICLNETKPKGGHALTEMDASVHVQTPDVTGIGELESRDESTESLTFISNTSSSVLGETITADEKMDFTRVPQPVWDGSVDKTYSSTSFSSSDDESKIKTEGKEDCDASQENNEKPETAQLMTSFGVGHGDEAGVNLEEDISNEHVLTPPLSTTQKVEMAVCGDEKTSEASHVDIPLEKLASDDLTVSSPENTAVTEYPLDKNGNKKASKETTKKEKNTEKGDSSNTKYVSPPTEQPKRKSKLFSWPFKWNKKKQEDHKQKEDSLAKEEPEKEAKQADTLSDPLHVNGCEVDSTGEEPTKTFERMAPRTSTPLRHDGQARQNISQTSEAAQELGTLSPDQTRNGELETTFSTRSASKRLSSKSSSSSSSETSTQDAGRVGSDSGIPSLSFISQVESVDMNVSAPSKLSSRPELCPETTKERSALSKSSSSSKESDQERKSSLAKKTPSFSRSKLSPEASRHHKRLMAGDTFHDDGIHNKEKIKTIKDQPKNKNKLKEDTKLKTKATEQNETEDSVPGEERSRDKKKIKTTKPPRQKSKPTKGEADHESHLSTSSFSSGDDKSKSTQHEPTEHLHHNDNSSDQETLQITKEFPAAKSPDKKRSKLFGKKLPDLQIKQDVQLEELPPSKKDESTTGKSPATPRSKSVKISKYLPGLLSPTKKEPDVSLEDSLDAEQRFDGQFHREDDITQGVAEDVTAKGMKTPPTTPASENFHYEEGHCDNHIEPVATSQLRHFVVVAIDFGTTHSGYAFSFVRDPTSVYMMRRWAGEEPGVVNQKTLTSLLLTPEGEFHSFGYSARSSYLNLIPVEAKHWMYFSTFKMELHHNADLNRETMLVALNGAKFSALKVFAYALDFFKNHALQQLSDQSGTELLNDDIRWVITVPAIWKAPAKQFMRQAAYEAGLASPSFPEQLLIALEPEAASIYCRRLRMHQLIPDQPFKRPLQSPSRSSVEVSGELAVTELTVDLNKSSSSSRATLNSLPDEIVDSQIQGSRYLIVDCGGGTVDITVHELDPLGHIIELHRATGGPHGSIGVDAEFEKLLCGIFGIEFIEHYKRKYPMGWVHLMTDFESRKRSASPFKSTSLNVSPPFTFINDYKKHKSDPETAVKRYGDSEVEWSPQGMLRLTPIAMRRLFLPTLTHIKQAVGDVLNHPNARELKYMFLVGGFAESPLLQHEMRQEFGSIMKILIPQEVSLAILKGAVLFGIDPSIVNIRRSRLTYGVGILNRFDSNIHPESKRVKRDGVDWCIDVFDKYVETDQPVMLGTSVVRSYTPAKRGQVSIILNIYSSLNSNVRFITDPGVTRCGTLCLSLTALEDNVTEAVTASAPGPREIQTRMSFGDTEISVVATDVATGKLVKASVDFLGR